MELIELVRCAQRELRRRRGSYPMAVATKTMSQAEADRELAAQEAIVAHLEAEANQMRFEFD